ncbi:hypothetical protein SESBI_31455 [Sesbania bispinosa]|nr:hypothetical protein SESBI_31455 [Sesbania bispinosa]
MIPMNKAQIEKGDGGELLQRKPMRQQTTRGGIHEAAGRDVEEQTLLNLSPSFLICSFPHPR